MTKHEFEELIKYDETLYVEVHYVQYHGSSWLPLFTHYFKDGHETGYWSESGPEEAPGWKKGHTFDPPRIWDPAIFNATLHCKDFRVTHRHYHLGNIDTRVYTHGELPTSYGIPIDTSPRS